MNGNNIVVKKLGGENAAELDLSTNNIIEDYEKGVLQAVVISAMRSKEFNTTDKLIEIGNELGKTKNYEKVSKIIEEIKQFHLKTAKEKIQNSKLLENLQNVLNEIFSSFGKIVQEWILNGDIHILPCKDNDYSISLNGKNYSIIGFGEEISAKVFSEILNTKAKVLGIIDKNKNLSEGLYLDNVISSNEINGKSEKEIFKFLYKKLGNHIQEILNNGIVPILSGYVGKFENGIENAIGRGYSDSVASALAVGLAGKSEKEVILEIQKKVLGILSCDENLLDGKKAKLIENINYISAREITGSRGANAKVLHSQTLREELLDAGIKIHVFDPFNKDSKGTWITPKGDISSKEVQFVGGKKDITLITISSSSMCQGFLAKVFDIIKDKVSVDVVSTSETEVTISLNNGNTVEEIKNLLETRLGINNLNDENHMNFIEVEKDKALINCIGQNMRDKIGILMKAADTLCKAGINVEIVSQGYLQRAITFGIKQEKYNEAIKCLHKNLIEN